MNVLTETLNKQTLQSEYPELSQVGPAGGNSQTEQSAGEDANISGTDIIQKLQFFSIQNYSESFESLSNILQRGYRYQHTITVLIDNNFLGSKVA